MREYLNFLKYIKEKGVLKGDRTGTGTTSIFGYQMRFDLQKGFPLVTTKKIHIPSVVHELLWFLSGSTNIKYLNDNNVRIWNEWATADGELGPIYGKQWRDFNGQGIDQIVEVIEMLKTNPNSRRILVSAWNPCVVPSEKLSPQENVAKGNSALPPCHAMFQFYVANNKLSCMLTQRSADAFLGVPFNIASYSLLTHMVAQQCDFDVGEFIWSGGDCHIYNNHIEQVNEQLSRKPLDLPTLKILRKPNSIFDYKYKDFEFEDYNHHPTIKAKISV
ncbi:MULTISPECIES: thymidylate synthase [Francisella]|uniref:Thymidylate synthase n=1 Tax=Francisella opportunistica TaxID=2016517 RepID=A0A345JQK2_9GAMM|nr:MULTISPECIES: thymidylate synthase [Francisella]APC91303.1 Thymidylate synthase [Francisella sp. MA067296]AXH29598.1 thymidylate synthase [Francisella opportunistica]AXH31249.1 thymidylate synthase [Francisella opportunistica]AXH32896.1 thymidylate synthase [Francisella opportunistica]